MEMIAIISLSLFVGYILGYVIAKRNKHYDGIFRVDTSNPDKDVFSLELECALGSIPEKKELIFKVANECSQEKPFL